MTFLFNRQNTYIAIDDHVYFPDSISGSVKCMQGDVTAKLAKNTNLPDFVFSLYNSVILDHLASPYRNHFLCLCSNLESPDNYNVNYGSCLVLPDYRSVENFRLELFCC